MTLNEQKPKMWRILLLIILLGLFIRLGVGAFFKNRCSPGEVVGRPSSEAEYLRQAYIELGDSQQYLELAKSLRARRFFSWDGKTAVTFRTPGYPLLLAILGNNLPLLIIVQSLLSILTVGLVFLICREWFNEPAGMWAAGLTAFDLSAIAYTGMVMSETLFVLFLALGTWLFAVAWQRKRWCFILSGISLALAALTRPIALFAFLPFVVLLGVSEKWRWVGLFLFSFATLPVGWIARNYFHYRHLGFSSIGGYNLFFYNAAALKADQEGIPFQTARENLEREYASQLTGENPLQLADRLGRKGLTIILSDPLRYAKVYIIGLAKVLLGIGSDEIVFRMTGSSRRLAQFKEMLLSDSLSLTARGVMLGLATVEVITTLTILVFTLLALIKFPDKLTALLFILGWYFILAAAPLPSARFRIPAVPFFSILTGATISRLRRT